MLFNNLPQDTGISIENNFEKHEVIQKIIQFIPIQLIKFQINQNQIDQSDIEGSYNNQLSMYLNACITNEAFQFQHEFKRSNRRRPDIGVAIKTQILLSNYESVFDIECKRLNTSMQPHHVKRYVSGETRETGGIERFKRNLHGTNLENSAMIGYIENKTTNFWFEKINSWIENKINEDNEFWKDTELIKNINQNYYSTHKRINAITNSINIFHFFIMLPN